jgi:alpha-tubulin suppressor-like RCC1 family protein
VEPIQIQALNMFAIIKVTAGENHSLAVTNSGQVFSWGSNSFGQLGQNIKAFSHESRLIPMRIEALRSHFVIDIAASSCHSAAITSSGEVFTWGSNKKGQLGRKEGFGTDQPNPIPKRVDALILSYPQTAIYENYTFAQAKKVAVSDFHTCVILRVEKKYLQQLGNYGQVWQFGYGSKTPSRVGFTPPNLRLSGEHWDEFQVANAWIPSWKKPFVDIVQVACARQHSIALCSAGNVYTWGHNSNVLTSSSCCKNSTNPSSITTQTPGSSQQVTGVLLECGPVVSINAAHDHCAVVTREGDLYTWGSGIQGVLGHGKGITWQPQPQRVKYLKKVIAVATSSQHTCVLTAPIHDISYSNSSMSFYTRHKSQMEAIDKVKDDDVNPEDLFDVLQGNQSLDIDSDSDEDSTICRIPTGSTCPTIIPSLFDLCQRKIATYLDVSTAPLILKYAEWIQANDLIKTSQAFLRLNMDQLFEKAQDVHKLERLFDALLPESILSEEIETEIDQLPSTNKTPSSFALKDGVVVASNDVTSKLCPALEEMKPPMIPNAEENLDLENLQEKEEDLCTDKHQNGIPVVVQPLQTQNSKNKKKKNTKFVSLESFFTKKTSSSSSSSSAPSLASAGTFLCPWGASPNVLTSTPVPLPTKISPIVTGKSNRSIPLTSFSSSTSQWALKSPSSGTGGKSFSLEDLLVATTTKKKKVSKKQYERKDFEQKKLKAWGGEVVVPSTSSLCTSKTLLDIQKEEEEKQKKAEEIAAASKIDKWSQRVKLSTINSWGLCEPTESIISLAEVQKKQAQEQKLQKKREEEELRLVLEVVAKAEMEEELEEKRQQQKQLRHPCRNTPQKKEALKEKKDFMGDDDMKKNKINKKKKNKLPTTGSRRQHEPRQVMKSNPSLRTTTSPNKLKHHHVTAA